MLCIGVDVENLPSDYKVWVINTCSFVIVCPFYKSKQEKISKLIMKSSNHNHFLLLDAARVSTAQVFIVLTACSHIEGLF